jgi:hypothetical protein
MELSERTFCEVREQVPASRSNAGLPVSDDERTPELLEHKLILAFGIVAGLSVAWQLGSGLHWLWRACASLS